MAEVMRIIMTGQATPAQIGGFLIGLRMKGETVDEIVAAAKVMRELSAKVELDPSLSPVIDTCGTGGDGASTFNISTASAFVVAAAGGYVAKHGNRSISSQSGSADLLEAAGVNLDLTPEQIAECVKETGVGFMFAPKHHGAMKHAIGPRKEMAVRTIFNVLGPLTNPASAPHQVLGVFDAELIEPMAQVLNQLGSKHVLVVSASDGLDEFSLGGPTHVAELKNGEVSCYDVNPDQFGFAPAPSSSLSVSNAQESLDIIKKVFSGGTGAASDIVALNAGAAIYAGDLADSLDTGVQRAMDILQSGQAQAKLDAFVKKTQSFTS
jgi:anthranilate phosphoribosyltransferase